jgi:hypothetical protein
MELKRSSKEFAIANNQLQDKIGDVDYGRERRLRRRWALPSQSNLRVPIRR